MRSEELTNISLQCQCLESPLIHYKELKLSKQTLFTFYKRVSEMFIFHGQTNWLFNFLFLYIDKSRDSLNTVIFVPVATFRCSQSLHNFELMTIYNVYFLFIYISTFIIIRLRTY